MKDMNNTNLSPFDKELIAYKNGELGDNHIFNLGKPAGILKECGFHENNRIELSASRLKLKATQGNHIYDFLDIQGLDKALQNPIAVFEYGDKKKSQNVIVNIEKGGKNFLVGVFFNQKRDSFEVSSIRGLFNRTNIDWIRWIEQGKMIYGNKSEIKKVIEKIKNNVQVLTTQQRTNLAEVNSQEARTSSDSYYLNTVINILDKYEERNDFYTKKFPEYEKECKERYELYRLFKNAYLQTDSVEESDAPIQAAQVYQALKENNKEVIDYYIENDNEISEIVKSLYEANNTNISLLQKESLISKNIENKETNEIIKKLDNEVNRLKKELDYLYSMNPEELEDIAKEMKVYKDKDLGSRMERKAKSLVAEKQGIKHKQKSRNEGMEY